MSTSTTSIVHSSSSTIDWKDVKTANSFHRKFEANPSEALQLLIEKIPSQILNQEWLEENKITPTGFRNNLIFRVVRQIITCKEDIRELTPAFFNALDIDTPSSIFCYENKKFKTLLDTVLQKEKNDFIASLLLRHSKAKSQQLFIEACKSNCTKSAEEILSGDYKEQQKSSLDREFLIACGYDNLNNVTSIILDLGINPLQQNPFNRVPLHFLALKGDVTLIEKFFTLYPETPVDTKDKGGATPLHLALCNQHVSNAKILLEKGASLEMALQNIDFLNRQHINNTLQQLELPLVE